MSTVRIALANIQFPATPDESVALAEHAIAHASIEGADIVCFPECFVPGYRGMGKQVAPPDAGFLERAWSVTAKAAAKGNIAVVLGTERIVDDGLRISVLVVNREAHSSCSVLIWKKPDLARTSPSTFADPANTFHEKAALCRAAENTCFFAIVNCASPGSRTTSAVVRPDGTLLNYQPYGKRGVLIADIDITQATRLLAKRHKPIL